MTHEWKKLGFTVKESETLFSVYRLTGNPVNDDVERYGYDFIIDDEITCNPILYIGNEYPELIQKTIEYLQDKNDLIHVMGNEWKHLKNHANKVNGK
jgi:hypothetical protein